MKTTTASKLHTQVATLLLCLGAGGICFAQSALQPLTPTSIVTGACLGRETQPGCVLPNLFGPNGLTLYNNPVNPHFAHFVGPAQQTLNQTLTTAIASQLATLPIISPSSGFTYKYDSAAGAFVRTTTSFGPIYTERAETIGRGKFSFGISYQRFRFSSLDGTNLHNVPLVLTHVPNTGPGGSVAFYEVDAIQTANNISLNMDQTLVYGTVGLTDRLDFSVAVPIVSVRMGAVSDAQIIRVAGNPASNPDPHEFDASGRQTAVFTSNGSASGIGDVTFRIKANVLQAQPVRVALIMDVRAPSGSARRLLGSGATGIKPFIAVSAGKRFAPHVNLGYQWNGQSILAGNLTGTTVVGDSYSTGPATSANLPAQFFYSLGADVGATSRLTLVFDYLGQTLFDAPRVFRTNVITADRSSVPGGLSPQTLATITGGKDTVGYNSGAAGLKFNLFSSLVLTGDLLFRLDNKGLRQDVTPLVALSYAFGR
jgi:hypothetical protein